ncbi:unnamed protein product [Acanthoscelides obtectus]|uniref:Cytochrome P450 n=1 Tax=Acanthoscelides obtectus TaxID=200917 RepID=A0A9P0MAA3_ACAOB|nr:unnamed protein product [Acanthoscelides obtectus]CAK1677620.1 Probable cytochrome P450 49a1 [Acanthoscelides obtectus]
MCSAKTVTANAPVIKKPQAEVTREPPKATTIHVNTYLDAKKTAPIISHNMFSYDEIPGPLTLRMINKFWSMIPVMGSEVTVRIIQYLLSGGRFFGDLLSWGGNPYFFKKFFRVYGPVVRLHGAFGSDVVLLSRPEHACAVFQSEGQYPIRSCLESMQKYRLDCRKYQKIGPFFMYGADWERLRKAMEEQLKDSIVKQYETIDRICDDFVERIKVLRNPQEEMPNDFLKEIHKWSLESLCSVTLNKRFGFLDTYGLSPTSDAGVILQGLTGATQAIRKCEYGLHVWKFIETPAWKSLVKHCDMVENVLDKHVADAIESLKYKKDKLTGLDSASMLESLVLKHNTKYQDVMTVMLDMFLIGTNATAHTVGFLLYHLAKNPRCQIKLYGEVKKNPTANRDTLKRMPYLQACMKECLRLNPAIPILSRVLTNDIVVHNYQVPKGTHVLFASHLNSYNEEYFEDATRFKPERWLDNELGGFGNEYQAFATMPFGYGAKSCVAKELAEVQIAMLTYKVCKNFKIEYNYGDITSSSEMLAQPTKPLKFRFVDRA